MEQKRFNNLALLYFYKERTDAIDIIYVANDFIINATRASNFGKFTAANL